MNIRTLASVATLSLAFALPGHAALVTRAVNQDLPSYMQLDIDANGTNDLQFGNDIGLLFRVYGSGRAVGSNGLANVLAAGDDISASSALIPMGMGVQLYAWAQEDVAGYLGFTFSIDGMDHYGFAELANAGGKVRLLSVGYESMAGQALAAGGSTTDVPEPTSLALVGIAALAGIGASRRRRAA